MKLVLVAILITITGCAEIGAIRHSIAKYGENGADQTLESSIWGVCVGASVGAVERYFNTPKKQKARTELCGN